MTWPFPLFIILILFYGSSYWDMAQSWWQLDEYSHGPVMLLIVVWLFWRERTVWGKPLPPSRVAGAVVITAGLLVYVVGRALSIPLLELGSQIPVLAGLLLSLGGWRRLWQFRFALGFLLFAVPLPGVLVDAMTVPLKLWIAGWAENTLYLAGYPVARSGAVLSLSQYRLLVADACSGLSSMISLAALGLLYVHLVQRKDRLHRALLLASVIPVAVVANLGRVLFILLITYHFGDAAGQGPLHDLIGIGVFVLAFWMLMGLDAALLRLRRGRPLSLPRVGVLLTGSDTLSSFGRRQAVFQGGALAFTLLLAGGAAEVMRPQRRMAELQPRPSLETEIPREFGSWRLDPGPVPVSVQPSADSPAGRSWYSRTLERTYVDGGAGVSCFPSPMVPISCTMGCRRTAQSSATRRKDSQFTPWPRTSWIWAGGGSHCAACSLSGRAAASPSLTGWCLEAMSFARGSSANGRSCGMGSRVCCRTGFSSAFRRWGSRLPRRWSCTRNSFVNSSRS